MVGSLNLKLLVTLNNWPVLDVHVILMYMYVCLMELSDLVLSAGVPVIYGN